MTTYKCITVRDIVNHINNNSAKYPNGLDTKVMSGDFECNYTHEKHEIQNFDTGKYGFVICLGYEMHENFSESES